MRFLVKSNSYRFNCVTPTTLTYPVNCEQHLLNPKDRYIISFGALGYPRRGGIYIRYGIYDSVTNSIEFRRLEGELLPYGLCFPI